jgi:DNA-directed RNA polymerase beta' subunit
LTPYDVKIILKKIDMDHWRYFLNNSDAPSPIGMLVDTVPVPPLCIRPTVRMTDEKKNEDDATVKIFEMIKQKESISKFC